MASEDEIKNFKEHANVFISNDFDRLFVRAEWGAIHFKEIEADLRRVRTVLQQIVQKPLEWVPTNALNEWTQYLSQLNNNCGKINRFNITQSNALNEQRDLINYARRHATDFIFGLAYWLPFLAYVSGEFQEYPDKISKALEAFRTRANQAEEENNRQLDELTKATSALQATNKQELDQLRAEAQMILKSAREAAGINGVTQFSKNFDENVSAFNRNACWWLVATGVLAAATLYMPFHFLEISLAAPLSPGVAIQVAVSKIAIMTILLTATLWCGRIYKSLKHQAAVYQHRALGLKTFEAFANAAGGDPATKSAVLMATTRAIFADYQTGYINDQSTSEGETKVVEIVKSAISRKGEE